RIEPLCRTERPNGLGVVEAEGQHHALIEVPLRARIRGGDGPVVFTHPFEERGAGASDELGIGLDRLGSPAARQDEHADQRCGKCGTHSRPPDLRTESRARRPPGLKAWGCKFARRRQAPQKPPVLLTKATVVPSGDHDGTLMVPWPPYTYAITRAAPPSTGISRRIGRA